MNKNSHLKSILLNVNDMIQNGSKWSNWMGMMYIGGSEFSSLVGKYPDHTLHLMVKNGQNTLIS